MSGEGGPPDLSVVPEEVQAVGRYVLDTAKTLFDALDSAGGDVRTLTSGGWTGSAAKAFGNGWDEVQDGGSKIIDELTTLAAKLGVTAASYQAVDQAIASSVTADDLPRLNW